MFNVRGQTYYVGPPPVVALTPPDVVEGNPDGPLARLFREALLKNLETFSVEIRLPGYPLLNCNFARCGQAAGVAQWWRRGREPDALTAYLPGLEDEEEHLVEQVLAVKRYPISLHNWHNVLEAKRPVHANFLLTPGSSKDPLIPPGASALAFSFFSILGVVDNEKLP